MKYTTAIMAHESRAEYLPYLYKMLGREVPTYLDRGRPGDALNLGVWRNCARAWRDGLERKEQATWHLVLQDDAILTHQFHEKLEALLATVADDVQAISLYLGGSSAEVVKRAKAQGGDHLRLPQLKNEVALLLRTAHIEAMLDYCEAAGATDDKLITQFVESKGWDVLYPLPSLVDHRDLPSLYREFYPDPSRPADVRRHAAWFEQDQERATVLILAAGDATRWDNYLDVPKHLVSVTYQGEVVSLLARTVAQLNARGIEPVIIAKHGRAGYEFRGAKTEYVETDFAQHDGADKFLSSSHLWSKQGKTIVLWGDVFFTEWAIDTILATPVDGWHLFCRPGPSTWSGSPYGENFALAFYPDAHALLHEHLERIIEAKFAGEAKRCGGWELYRSLVGVGLNDHEMRENYTEIYDWTEDFDYPEDYDRWLANRVRFKREVKQRP